MKKTKNIDFYISSLSGGGAEHVLINLADGFQQRGNNVTITSLERREQFYTVPKQIEVFRYDHTKYKGAVSFIKDILAVRKQLKYRADVDVSISFLGRTNMVLSLASIGLKKKTIICDRNNLAQKYSRIVFAALCRVYSLADILVVQTNEIKSVYPQYLQKKIRVLENPLDFVEMDKQCIDEAIVKENTIISVGRLEKQKDYRTLIDAFSLIADKYPEWNIRIFGKGKMQEEIQGWIDGKELTNRILLCGTTHRPFYEMKKSKIFILSSFFEGFPNVLCEAMYAGLPCIATSCMSGPRDLNKDNETGILVSVGDSVQMAQKMELLINSKDERERLGKNAYVDIQRLESNKVYVRWLDMIDESI